MLIVNLMRWISVQVKEKTKLGKANWTMNCIKNAVSLNKLSEKKSLYRYVR
jgi:hypothetical protein